MYVIISRLNNNKVSELFNIEQFAIWLTECGSGHECREGQRYAGLVVTVALHHALRNVVTQLWNFTYNYNKYLIMICRCVLYIGYFQKIVLVQDVIYSTNQNLGEVQIYQLCQNTTVRFSVVYKNTLISRQRSSCLMW